MYGSTRTWSCWKNGLPQLVRFDGNNPYCLLSTISEASSRRTYSSSSKDPKEAPMTVDLEPFWNLSFVHFWVGLEYELHIQYPKGYPWDPFRIKVCTPLYHVAIDNRGRWCSYLLTAGWAPHNLTKDVSRMKYLLQVSPCYFISLNRYWKSFSNIYLNPTYQGKMCMEAE